MAKTTKNRQQVMPSAIRILGAVYEIHVVSNLLSKENIHGDCDSEKRIIRINKTEVEDMMATLFHESLHALFAESGIHHLFTCKVEETIVSVLENYLKDNVDLTSKFIMTKVSEESSNDKHRLSSRKRISSSSRKRVPADKKRKRSSIV